MSDTTIKTVPGYGESVRRQLEQLGWHQTELAERSGVTRQTISRAVNRDEVSDRTAERIAAALGRVPARVSQAGASRTNPVTVRDPDAPPLFGRGLCDAMDLEVWANRRDAQSLLPKLIRRLVYATGRGITEMSFRADEGVQLSGWDGIVHTEEPASFVPVGSSGWEMGTGKDPRRKAEDDLANRSGDSSPLHQADTTFMFVTPRRWRDKEEWSRKKTEEGGWRQVRVLDADDIATWLETAPAVHRWLSTRIGKIPPDSVDLEWFWGQWSAATHPALSEAVILAGRDGAANDIHERLRQPEKPFGIAAESRHEAVAVLYAALSGLPPKEREKLLSRAIVVESAGALRHLVGSRLPLLLVPTFEADELVSAAARAGHSVVVPLGAGDPESDRAVQLEPLRRLAVVDALDELGIERDRAHKMAALARRSLTAFRRTIAVNPGLRRPEWAKPTVGRSVVPALLGGSWNGAKSDSRDLKDREILAALSRRPYEELVDDLIPWSMGPDPFIRRHNDTWYLVAPEDAWRLLASYVTSDDLERFEQAAMTILGMVHPKYELPTDERFMAGALGHTPSHSGLLARGLVQTLAIMGVFGQNIPSINRSARDVAAKIVRQLLEAANQDWKLWASLSQHLPLFAEAAPDEFLDGVEHGLEGPQPILACLFSGEERGMFGSSPHTGLLWALERIAWSVPRLGRVVRLLARLDRVDPGSKLLDEDDRRGRLSNRPLASLQAIFRSWRPDTAADLPQRLAALDGLREVEAEVAWHVMLSMLPQHHSVASAASSLSFRDWALERKPITYGDIAETTQAVVNRLRDDAEVSGRRWADLVQRLANLPIEQHEAVVHDLKNLDISRLDKQGQFAIWTALRDLVAKHRTYRGAEWAMPEIYVEKLDVLKQRFAPLDLTALYGWLFSHHPDLPIGDDVTETSWEEREEALLAERVRAVEEVLNVEGLDGLVSFSQQVEYPPAVGVAAACTDKAHPLNDDFLVLLQQEPPALADFAIGYVGARSRAMGKDWIVEQVDRRELDLEPDQKAALLQALPANPDTWKLARDCGEDVWREYWRTIPVFAVTGDHASEASSKLISVNRPFAAVDLLGVNLRRESPIPAEIIGETLEAALSAEGEQDEPSNHFVYAAGELLDALYRADFDEERLARLEWGLLPVLDQSRRRPRALHRLLSEKPDFFVDVVSLVFRAEDDESSDLSTDEQARARVGYSLLQEWRRIPGHRKDADVDSDHLHEWVATVRKLLESSRRVGVGLHVLGQVFSGSPSDPDGSWPCKPVRDVIESLESDDLEKGIVMGVYNGRGVTWRDPAAGGAQERALADRYDGLAAHVSSTHPRTSRLLRHIAETYRRDAHREDFESLLREDLGV